MAHGQLESSRKTLRHHVEFCWGLGPTHVGDLGIRRRLLWQVRCVGWFVLHTGVWSFAQGLWKCSAEGIVFQWGLPFPTSLCHIRLLITWHSIVFFELCMTTFVVIGKKEPWRERVRQTTATTTATEKLNPKTVNGRCHKRSLLRTNAQQVCKIWRTQACEGPTKGEANPQPRHWCRFLEPYNTWCNRDAMPKSIVLKQGWCWQITWWRMEKKVSPCSCILL